MADSFIQVAPDSTGKKMQTYLNTIAGSDVHAESIAPVNSSGIETPIGIATETAPATDTASSGLNGRLQRIAQRITSLIATVATNVGAANLATSQVTSTGTAATLAVARPTRRSVLFTNTHASGSVRIGPATVTAGNGQVLGPGQSCPFSWVGLFQVIDDNSTHCVICVADEYD